MIECSGTRTRKKEQEQEQEQFFATLCLSLNNEMQIRQKAKANTQIRMRRIRGVEKWQERQDQSKSNGTQANGKLPSARQGNLKKGGPQIVPINQEYADALTPESIL